MVTPTVIVPPDLRALGPSLFDLLDDVLKHVAEEDRDDRGRSFVGPQPVVVGRGGDGDPEQVAVTGDRADDGGQEEEELGVLVRGFARLEQVVPLVVRHRPVQVLARSVDPGERLLVEQHLQAVAAGDALEGLHDQHVVVGGDVGVLEQGGDFILGRGHFVVPRLDRHAQLVEFELPFEHAGENPLGDGAEVVVLHLLALGGLGTEEGAAGVDQVGPGEVEVAVDQEVFLLGAAGRVDLRQASVPNSLRMRSACFDRRFHRAEQRGLLVQRLRRSTSRTRSGCRGWCRWGSRG